MRPRLMKLPVLARISPTARAAVASAKQAQEAAKAARAYVDEIEACLIAAQKAASDTQHQADLAAAHANRLAPDTLIMRSPAPDNPELIRIAEADPSGLEGLTLKQIVETIELPSFDLPYAKRDVAKQPCGAGELQVNSSGFTYTEWDSAASCFKMYMGFTAYSPSNISIHMSQYHRDASFSLDEIIGTKWESVVRGLLIETWIRRHGIVARELANAEYQGQIDRQHLLQSLSPS